jgi:hypothetical protein
MPKTILLTLLNKCGKLSCKHSLGLGLAIAKTCVVFLHSILCFHCSEQPGIINYRLVEGLPLVCLVKGLWRIPFHSQLQDALSYLSVPQTIPLVLSFSEPLPSQKIQTVAHEVSGQWYYRHRHLSSSSSI